VTWSLPPHGGDMARVGSHVAVTWRLASGMMWQQAKKWSVTNLL